VVGLVIVGGGNPDERTDRAAEEVVGNGVGGGEESTAKPVASAIRWLAR
jgi:hypothetical protein